MKFYWNIVQRKRTGSTSKPGKRTFHDAMETRSVKHKDFLIEGDRIAWRNRFTGRIRASQRKMGYCHLRNIWYSTCANRLIKCLALQWLKVLSIPIPSVFITADLVKTGKPSPEGYLMGRERLHVNDPVHKVVVFEDAAAGVRAGKAAGAIVIAVIETHTREALEEAGADYIIDGLDRVRLSGEENGQLTIEVF
jgi:HAD-hyrolase-like